MEWWNEIKGCKTEIIDTDSVVLHLLYMWCAYFFTCVMHISAVYDFIQAFLEMSFNT